MKNKRYDRSNKENRKQEKQENPVQRKRFRHIRMQLRMRSNCKTEAGNKTF